MIMFQYYNNAISLIKRYRLNSIFFIYLKRIFFIVSIPILALVIVIITMTMTTLNKNHTKDVSERFEPIAYYFEQCLEDIDKFQYKLEINDNVYRYASTNLMENGVEVHRLSSDISNMLVNYTASNPQVSAVHVYFPYVDFIISNRESNSLKNYMSSIEFNNLPNSLYHYFVHDKKSGLLKYIRPIYKNESTYAIVQYDINLLDLANMKDNESGVILLDHNNKVIYTHGKIGDFSLSPSEISKILSGTQDSDKSGNISVIGRSICDSQYGVIYICRISAYTGYGLILVITIFGILLLLIILPLTIALYFSMRFYTIISDVVFQFNLAESAENSSNELELLNSSILNILQKNKAVESDLIINSQKLLQAQIQALQLQISPHFIFNTLNLTNVIIMRELKRDNDAERVIYHLANLISEVLNTKDNIVTVYDELEYIKEFIEIEKIRFRNEFDVIYDIDDDVLERKTIKFILQPIVENAFEHGIKLLENKRGKLEIKAFCDGNDTLFVIKDNGKGFDNETLEKLKAMLSSGGENTTGHHIGIFNVHQRISLLCGEPYGVSIDSVPGSTTITVRLKI